MKILDCTLRDGGYYTNWDFDKELVTTYFLSFNNLPVDYLEIGYRSQRMNGYLGEYFYCPIYVIEGIKKISAKKLVIIIDEKDVRPANVQALLKPCMGLIDMVRIAIDPKNFKRALVLASSIKALGFQVGFNVMYMSKWAGEKEFLSLISEVNGIADYFYMVDSYGGVYPKDVKNIYDLVRSKTDVNIGFHGHNNLELALINTLTAIECGADIVDATITGMGRGAGNLKTELLLTALNSKEQLDCDFNALSNVVDGFTKLQEIYNWGTNLPYMVSGANSLPQKNVMEWVSKKFYSYNSIIRALQNQKTGIKDNENCPIFLPDKKYDQVIIVGGGISINTNWNAIQYFVSQNPGMAIIHSSSRNSKLFQTLSNDQFFCLAGNEGNRLEKVFPIDGEFKGDCILPPFPRKMGTYVPSFAKNRTYELKEVNFCDPPKDTHTALALQTALELNANRIFVIGYDGYAFDNISQIEMEIFNENEHLFDKYRAFTRNDIIALTNTKYNNISSSSVYSFI